MLICKIRQLSACASRSDCVQASRLGPLLKKPRCRALRAMVQVAGMAVAIRIARSAHLPWMAAVRAPVPGMEAVPINHRRMLAKVWDLSARRNAISAHLSRMALDLALARDTRVAQSNPTMNQAPAQARLHRPRKIRVARDQAARIPQKIRPMTAVRAEAEVMVAAMETEAAGPIAHE